jgi:hypothetical protein
MQFFLGTHRPGWLARLDVPLFVSARRLRGRLRLPRAMGPWSLDSGGFSEVSLLGRWETPAATYAAEVRRYSQEIGQLTTAAVQDWMCEPFITRKTELSVREHQRRTIRSYLELRQLAPDLPWMPVLQGWTYDDYLRHLDEYDAAGIDLAALPLVGLGSVCRRQDTTLAEELVRDLHGRGLRIHAFGFKSGGLARCSRFLASADSMAWSYRARHEPIRLPGCTHRNCANCEKFALAWRADLLASIATRERQARQPLLWEAAR